jgi:predicted SprT family Zn-dependent metalloprotease
MYKSLLILFLLPIFMKHNDTSHKLLYKCLAHDVMRSARQFSHSYLSYRCKRVSSNLAFVSDGRDSSSVLSDRQGDCLVFVVLCSVPVPRPVFSTRSARFAYICAVLRSSPANRPHNSLQRGPHWRKCRSSAFSSTHLKDPVLLHHKL